MTPEAQKEYIITELQLQSIEDDFFTNETLRQIRSRPAKSDEVLDKAIAKLDGYYKSLPRGHPYLDGAVSDDAMDL